MKTYPTSSPAGLATLRGVLPGFIRVNLAGETPQYEINAYSNEVFGDGEPGTNVSVYLAPYDGHIEPVASIKIPGYLWEEDWWGVPKESTRRIVKELRKAGVPC